MQFEKIKVSSRTTHLFGMLKTRTGINAEAWARMAICLSIKQRGIPNPDEYNTKGAEFTPAQIFVYNQNIYLALMINRLRQDGLDPELYLHEMTRAHINRGSISLKQRVNHLFDVYSLMDEMNLGSLQLQNNDV